MMRLLAICIITLMLAGCVDFYKYRGQFYKRDAGDRYFRLSNSGVWVEVDLTEKQRVALNQDGRDVGYDSMCNVIAQRQGPLVAGTSCRVGQLEHDGD